MYALVVALCTQVAHILLQSEALHLLNITMDTASELQSSTPTSLTGDEVENIILIVSAKSLGGFSSG